MVSEQHSNRNSRTALFVHRLYKKLDSHRTRGRMRCLEYRRLRRYLFSVFFLIFTDYECLQQISKIGESKPRIQRWMEFLSACNCRLSYRRGRDNANADFLSPLPIPPTAEDISGSSALTDPDDLGVYLIRACGYTTSFCPIPGVGLGGLNSLSFNNPGTGPNPSPTSVLEGLHLTKADFRTHRSPTPLRRLTGPTTSPFATPADGPCLSYAINDQHEIPRSDGARHTRSRTATLAGNTPLRPDYRKAARRGFAASAAPPPPRSGRLGSTIPLGRLTSPHPPPVPNSQMDNPTPTSPPVVQYPSPGNDNLAAVGQLSNALLSYSHRDWGQAQRVDPLCDATRRYIKLGYPHPPLSHSAITCPHTRGLKLRISSTSPLKVAYYREMMTSRYLCEILSPPPRRLMATSAAGSDIPLMTQSAFMCRS